MLKRVLQKAMFAAGCFWGVEAAFRKSKGVTSTLVGYTGGLTENPMYEQVCTGATKHAEAVQITYDPAAISYEELLEIFWSIHNPTTMNRQGPDIGSQYRSAIFYNTEAQKQAAEKSKKELVQKGIYKQPIVTEITKADEFYKAEEYHQQYLQKRNKGSCHI
ncbi:MAG: peptide-methionine (S)-S-oxide reductase [Candidatus Kerfeldbacteria bacterium RIFCSPHIGHO2_02_FULL_42_14]|uniref:Peptide methionine sulfoxide reductase MsrA n=1 Tax=Candidatus Kerfeldbacteria bacterium RIFCSPHIGHO2_02_FULL_42_14 TaxID=1798540 RepID=A0A1G2ATI9_9BACT|nr:MAG: peptide-methionine (S)-S-oxide reductase [Candidatus Kerfeldbacteria bacterium RIFCSPHIGHO2_02_FULL_42_14]OGY82074.1 MAG: peptide-methionine (S)-S-oxide reductase [Candidatus Kerfeldbacteria bacterium RIFCSPHIGHO2_12_FULL_42_13]OGY84514.1 MAG: peptide-methionine (S)-S-oxide reductase [Candidatus Kerfeldbacteria bacterium RIFCSPLOWO2_02_FULL_42_19]OGY86452.1 MAG: peptide-methionine (S)-S-oxide reductase [Candidatus Kerfeldbacteria bacterium RIFCSPLOWO2_12_FULL_43_9]